MVENYVRRSEDMETSAFSLLSQREREELQLMAEGKTTKQIARHLYISPQNRGGTPTTDHVEAENG